MEGNSSTLATRHKAVDAYYRLGSLKNAAREVNRPSIGNNGTLQRFICKKMGQSP